MAWQPPTQNVFDAGEMPQKKIITDEQQANLDANTPNKDVETMFGGQKMQAKGYHELSDIQIERVTDLLTTGNNQEISVFLEELKDASELGIAENVLADDFVQRLSQEITNHGKKYLLQDVITVAYTKELRPPMFFFGMYYMEEDDIMAVVITPVAEWMDHKRWNDQSLADYVIPEFLARLEESIYEFDADVMSVSKVRKELIKMGFVEQHEIVDGM